MTTMNINGLRAEIHTPSALRGDSLHALPPYARQPAYPVDEYPACPETWMHGSSLASSYFVPVEVGKGMWFNFTMNAYHTHDVAVVMSVQGVNPITGPIEKGKVAELRLEQYKHKCPRHGCDFQQDRYCPECKFKWPAQNYLSTTTGLPLWIDGFRNEAGEVRQYLITDDVAKGVAAQLIGDQRVFAIGFAFYESVEPKPKPKYTEHAVDSCGGLDMYAGDDLSDAYGALGSFGGSSYQGPTWVVPQGYTINTTQASGSANINSIAPQCNTSPANAMSFAPSPRVMKSATLRSVNAVKTLEIGAGARISQEVGVDTNDISYWKAEPTGLIYVNYVSTEECARILGAGKRQDKKDGAFANLNLAH